MRFAFLADLAKVKFIPPLLIVTNATVKPPLINQQLATLPYKTQIEIPQVLGYFGVGE